MRSRLVLFGVVIAMTLGVSACGATSTPSLTSTPLPTDTSVPPPTLTLTPTLTPTITPTPLPTLTPTPVVLAVFQNEEDWRGSDIFARVEGKDTITNLTEGTPGHKRLIGWSPNKAWILYGRYDGNTMSWGIHVSNSTLMEVWIMKPNGDEKKKLLDSTLFASTVSWSPDSERFLVNCPEGDNPEGICIIQLADFSVIHTGFTGSYQTFSPNGEFYAWNGFGDTGIYGVYVLEESSQKLTELFSPKVGGITSPIWASDSLGIYICNLRLPGNKSKIYYVKIDGTGDEEVATIDRLVSDMAISPKGDRLLLFTNTNYVSNKYGVIKTDGKGLVWFSGYIRVEWQEDNQLIGTKKDGTQYIINPETGKGIPK